MGAHPDDSSDVVVHGHPHPLNDVITVDPLSNLGPEVIRAHGPRLPFLLKILAAESPLSLQVHPTNEQARAGFADEDARGIPRTAPHRMYRDTHHKPELIHALTPFRALCGFRRVIDTIRLLRVLRAPGLNPILNTLTDRTSAAALAAAVPNLLSAEPADRTLLITEVLEACRRRITVDGQHGEFTGSYSTAVELGRIYPDDPGILISLLMNLVELEPGQALFLPAGNLHAYLHGTGIELMTNSDNVLRCGLTGKHINITEVSRIVNFTPIDIQRVKPTTTNGESVYRTPADEFQLTRIELTQNRTHQLNQPGPRILLHVGGTASLQHPTGDTATLQPGQSLFVPAGTDTVTITGTGSLFCAAVPRATRRTRAPTRSPHTHPMNHRPPTPDPENHK